MTEYGWVYCLSNPSYKKNYFKIGSTKRPDPLTRIRELNGATGVPTNFQLVYAKKVKDFKKRERTIHKLLNDCRVNKKREFFKYDKCKIEAIFSLMDGEWYSKKTSPIKPRIQIKRGVDHNTISFVKLNITQSHQKTIHNNYVTKGLTKKRSKLYKSLLRPENTFLIFYYPKKEYGNYYGCYGIYKLLKVDINKNFKEFKNYPFAKKNKLKSNNRKLTKEIKLMLKEYDEYIIYFAPIKTMLSRIKLKLPVSIFKNNRIGAIKNEKNITYLKKLLIKT